MTRAILRPLLAAAAAALAVTTPLTAEAAPKRTAVTKPKPPRPVRYVVVGTLSTVDATSLTLAPTTGGNAKVKPAPVTVTVAETATVVRDDVAASLADLAAGDHVAASGTRTGAAVVITKVIATSPEAPETPVP